MQSQRLILVFWFMWLKALICKIAFFVTIVIGDLTQVFIIHSKWPIIIVSISKISYIDSYSLGKALRSRAIIMAVYVIAFTFFVIFLSLIEGFKVFRAIKRLASWFLKPEQIIFKVFFLYMIIWFKGIIAL